MATGYYQRATATHLDGSPIFATEADKRSEDEVGAEIERQWRCELHRFGCLSPVDWYAVRDGRIVGLLELKTRSHESGKYPTVFLNVRKWLALSLAASGMGTPALFVVRFTDGIRWCKVSDIDASRIKVGGCTQIVKATSDIEPVIEVPVARLRTL